MVLNRATALGTSPGPTRSGTTDVRAGMAKENATPFAKERAKTCHTSIHPAKSSTAITNNDKRLKVSVTTRSTFRPPLSASTPPRSGSTSMGMSCAALTAVTMNAESVRSRMSQPLTMRIMKKETMESSE